MPLSKIQSESINLADTFAFTGTVSGTGDLTKDFHSAWTSDVAQVLANNVVTTSFLHYKIFFRVQPDLNSVITVYLTTGGNTPADAVNVGVYQGSWGQRAASGTRISNSINASNAYATFPVINNIYANANCYAEMDVFNVRSGAVSGTTNISPARQRGFRFSETTQNVNASDIHFSNGGGQFFNSTSSDNPTVTGFKFAPHTGNWAQGEITVYGYNI